MDTAPDPAWYRWDLRTNKFHCLHCYLPADRGHQTYCRHPDNQDPPKPEPICADDY